MHVQIETIATSFSQQQQLFAVAVSSSSSPPFTVMVVSELNMIHWINDSIHSHFSHS